MMCRMAEASFGCDFDVVGVMCGGGGIFFVQAFCVCEME